MTNQRASAAGSAGMVTRIPPLARFALHSLWLLLPFGIMFWLAWSSWRADANIRNQRKLESAIRAADRCLDQMDSELGPWSPIPVPGAIHSPPVPGSDPQAVEARRRYAGGDFEAVLGSPEGLRSEAGLPLRSLAALQLIRKESDAERLTELAAVLTKSADFVTPRFLEAAEVRFHELKIPLPADLERWRERWKRMETESSFASEIDVSGNGCWMERDGIRWLIEIRPKSREWRIHDEARIQQLAESIRTKEERDNMPEGLGLSLSAAGEAVSSAREIIDFAVRERTPWICKVVLSDEKAYVRDDQRIAQRMTALFGISAAALLTGWILAGRSYVRAIDLARRQSEFMAAVSHEMRTPLAAMRLLAENLESGVAERSGQTTQHSRLIREECARLGGLVENILAFTRKRGAGSFEPFDVREMIEDAVRLVKPLSEKKSIPLEVHIGEFAEPPSGDAAEIRRLLLNLLDNALKHAPSGGRVSCSTSTDGPDWLLEVADNGPGIPKHERARIFDPFYRIGDELRRSTPGTGLGLALVKRSAEAHGGTVSVDDAPGGGSRFIVKLPMLPPAP